MEPEYTQYLIKNEMLKSGSITHLQARAIRILAENILSTNEGFEPFRVSRSFRDSNSYKIARSLVFKYLKDKGMFNTVDVASTEMKYFADDTYNDFESLKTLISSVSKDTIKCNKEAAIQAIIGRVDAFSSL